MAARRLHIAVRGAVQGVGFRPFIYRLATELGLKGWVTNSPQGVFIEAEGDNLENFLLRIERERPIHASIQSLESSYLDPIGYVKFEIRESDKTGTATAFVLPDIATCPECLAEILNPLNRRYLYPFTNCTNCGPRFSIIEALPYDRANTSMKSFTMCQTCRKEYEDPLDRRFHAQPNACPRCGPHLELWDEHGRTIAFRHPALLHAAHALRAGKIVAVKGIGGFQLMVDARNDSAVQRLRRRKHREEKPFALMYPTLEMTKWDCEVSALEERLLRSAESPIVLLRRSKDQGKSQKSTVKKDGTGPQSPLSSFGLQRASPIIDRQSTIASSIAPGNPFLGIMLPYSPLHHILMAELGYPVVATSGNLSDEPICTDEHDAVERLAGIADVFLVHNRPIVRHVDDSVARVTMGRELILRRARGYAPLPISVASIDEQPLLAVGAHLKNTVAITAGKNVFVSQHIGDLETRESVDAFREVIASFKRLYGTDPSAVVTDLHPDYLSTQHANDMGIPVSRVQHHYAHVASCMAENQLSGRVLGVSWDGTGMGTDGTIWGGEFLLTHTRGFDRAATFRRFRLPGGEQAIKQPRRTALGLLVETFGDVAYTMRDLAPLRSFANGEIAPMRTMLATGLGTPATSSVGRLFDGVASLLDLRQQVNFEGQAAMELEFAIGNTVTDEAYACPIENPPVDGISDECVIDWRPMIRAIVDDIRVGNRREVIAAKFHNALVNCILAVAQHVGEERVVLSGGCFQNNYLMERAIMKLRQNGFQPYWHQRIPPNDGGISLGQVYAYARERQHQARPQEVGEIAQLFYEKEDTHVPGNPR